ncbi:MAG TPA: nucleotide sugar dehydrogenase [Nitrososphaera sp.]|jgi:nucleotide sugar dehydrogenase|nr:nucleotide sugar dehydrogenase [Nitrososphaera sp.]
MSYFMKDSIKTHAVSANKNNADADLLRRVRSGEFKIAVYGLGHVGSPLASAWLRAGAHLIGVDNSSEVLENARKGRTHIYEPGVNEAFSKGLKEKRFHLYGDAIKASQESHFKLICVPVLLTSSFSADLSAVKQVTTAIGQGLKKGDVVSLNPSVPPGTSEDIVIPLLEEESGLKVEQDFYMVYNPERIYEGRAIEDIEVRYPAIVAGAGVKSLEIGAKLYSLVARKGVLKIGNMRTAEAEKLLEGVYRDVNIALANEMAKFCEKAGVDFWVAREAANSQPFCHIHKPGAGVGGACIPVYPQFILHAASASGVECKIISLGRNVNDSMPAYCVEQALKLIDVADVSKCIVALLGLGFRGGVSDTRLSPTYKVIEELKKLKVKEIRVHDPFITTDPNLPHDIMLTSNLSKAAKNAHLVILVSDHAEYRNITNEDLNGAAIYDGRGTLDRSRFAALRFASIGKPS